MHRYTILQLSFTLYSLEHHILIDDIHMMCAHEPSTHNYHSIHIIVDIMLSLDNQLIEEVIGSMETAGHPYWATVEHWRRWLSSMMAKSTQFFATAFSRRRATKAPSYHGPYVFLEKCR